MPRHQPQDESAPITKMTSANQTFALNPLLTRVPMSRRRDQSRKCGFLLRNCGCSSVVADAAGGNREELLHVSNDWATFASLATAFGTLVLAVATFASIRSANRSARIAQQALAVNLRPLLIASRLTDPRRRSSSWKARPSGWTAAGGWSSPTMGPGCRNRGWQL
jgi:hypothetical protein